MKKPITMIFKHLLKIRMFKSSMYWIFAFILIPYLSSSQTLNFVAYGDSRTYYDTHNSICSQINAENPQLVIHSGDLYDGYSSLTWISHFTSKPNLNALLNNNKILVARGNHESESEVLSLSPTFVRDNSITYSFKEGNVFFVCLGMDPSASVLESHLQNPEAQSADFRVIFHHYPVYSSGSHGASGDAALEAICDQYNVTMSFAGHDHHYERSKVMYNRTAVYSGNDVPTDVQGTTYIVTGGGGAPLYSAGGGSWTDYVQTVNHYCVLTAYNDRLEMTVKDINGAVLETFVRRNTPPVYHTLTVNQSPEGTITPSTGDYTEGEVVTVTATGNAGYAFDYWTGDLTGTTNPTTITMDGPKLLVQYIK